MVEKSQSALAEDHPAFLFAMGELSGQVKALAGELTQMRLDRSAERKEIQGRLVVLEAWRWRVLGASGVISLLITVTVTVVWGK